MNEIAVNDEDDDNDDIIQHTAEDIMSQRAGAKLTFELASDEGEIYDFSDKKYCIKIIF